MSKHLHIINGSGLTLILLFASGCGGARDAQRFNNAILAFEPKLKAQGVRLSDGLKRGLDGTLQGVAHFKRSVDEFQRELATIKSEAIALKAPDKKSARDFHAAFLRVLEVEEECIKTDYGDIIKVIEDKKLTLAAKQGKIQTIAQRMVLKENAASQAFLDAQKVFAKDYNLTIQYK